MPRQKSDEKRAAILEAATRVIVMQGLSAPTMVIAKEAGVANGSLFTYFATKISNPEKRRALAQLSVSDEITPETRAAGHKMMAPVADLLERARANGPMQKVSKGFLVALMNSVAEATMDFMTQDPANAKKHSKEGFDALWRMLR
jgi:AcrR family transcriptional regulator